MELDGFNEELKVAFEYNGEQHYIKNRFNDDRDLDYIKWKDNLKAKRCEENGIKLIVIPYLIREDKLKEYILSKII